MGNTNTSKEESDSKPEDKENNSDINNSKQ